MFLKKIIVLSAVATLFSATAYAMSDLDNQITYTYDHNGFTLFLEEPFKDYDRISVTLLNADKTFEDISSAGDINSGNILDIKTFQGKEIKDGIYSCHRDELSFLPYGWYNIKLTRTGLDGTVESVVYRYPCVSDEDINNAWTAFATTTESEFAGVWERYASKFYYQNDYKEVFDNYQNLGTLYVKVRNAAFDASSQDKFSIEKDIIKCCGYALSIYAMENFSKDEANKIVDKYGLPYSELLDFNDFDALYTIFTKAKKDINSSDFGKTIKKIYAYANIQDGIVKKTVSNVATSTTNHSDILGINLSYASDKKVTVNAVAAKMDSSNAYIYYCSDTWFKEIVDRIAAENNKVMSPGGGGGGGAGGGISGHGAATTQPTEIKNETKEISFGDMDGYSWAEESINRLYKKNVLSGTGDGKFSPGNDVKREEFVAMIVRAFELKIANGNEQEFSDVDDDSWYGEYIKIASSRGIINGTGNGLFGTGSKITRQDMAVILLNVMKLNNLSIVPEKSGYADRSNVAEYAGIAVDTLSQLKIINGFVDNTFMPQGYATRAEAAVVIDRMFAYINGGY